MVIKNCQVCCRPCAYYESSPSVVTLFFPNALKKCGLQKDKILQNVLRGRPLGMGDEHISQSRSYSVVRDAIESLGSFLVGLQEVHEALKDKFSLQLNNLISTRSLQVK